MASYIVGQVAQLTGTFRNLAGTLANPNTVTLVVRKPDGTFVTPALTPSSSSTGIWTAFVTLTQTGLWYYVFTGTGTVDAIDQGSLVVRGLYADLLTPTQLREHVTSPLGDDALQRLIDIAEAEIDARIGPIGSTTELIDGWTHRLVLSRPAASITSIVETDTGTTSTTLVTSDYVLRSPYVLERLSTGTNAAYYWNHRVSVTYVPVDDVLLRQGVLIDLVRLFTSRSPGVTSQAIGDWSESYGTAADVERDAILDRLNPPPVMRVV